MGRKESFRPSHRVSGIVSYVVKKWDKRRDSLEVPPGWIIVFLLAELARPPGEYDRALYTQIRASFLTARCDSESHVARKGLGRASGKELAAPKFRSVSESKELQT